MDVERGRSGVEQLGHDAENGNNLEKDEEDEEEKDEKEEKEEKEGKEGKSAEVPVGGAVVVAVTPRVDITFDQALSADAGA